VIYKNVRLGNSLIMQKNVIIGLPSKDYINKDESEWPQTRIGDNGVIRSGTKIYCAVKIGNNFKSGHNVMIREDTVIGDNVLVGTNSVIDGKTKIGNNVSIQSMVYIPTNTKIEDYVFIGPNAIFTNDKYPVRVDTKLVGPIIRKGASIGANSTILAGIEIGEGAIVAACAVVTKNVPAWTLAIGSPAKIKDLPENLKKLNKI
jgi:acetyltransferase-like isoleucine patch superfamily enzyme